LPNFAEKSSAEQHRMVYEALQSGRSVASNGPFLVFTVNGKRIGETAEILTGETANLTIAWSLKSAMGKMREIRVIHNGMVIDYLYDLTGSSVVKQYPVSSSGYFRVEGTTDQKHPCGTDYGAFTSPVWVDCLGQSIFLTAPLQITPASPLAGDTLQANFTIQNRSLQTVALSGVTVKGFNLNLHTSNYQDFPVQENIILEPGGSYTYHGSLALSNPSDYHFFCAYRISGEGGWHTDITGLKEDDDEKNVTIENPVTVSFAVNPAQPKAGEEVVFTANCQDQKGEIVSLDWYFGDDSMPQPPSNNPVVKHTYSAPGNYLVMLFATGTSGCSNGLSRYVNVEKGGPTFVSGVFFHSAHWTKANNPYIINNGGVRFNPGFTLTIDPGVIVKADRNAGLYVQGTLLAQGTKEEPIIFTSLYDDEFGGDTNGDGEATKPAPNNWMGVSIASYNSDSVISNAIIRYSGSEGGGNVPTGCVNIVSGQALIKNCELSHSARGIRLGYGHVRSAALSKIVNNFIHDNGDGIYLSAAEAIIVGNKIVDNNSCGVRLWASKNTVMINNLIAQNYLGIDCNCIGLVIFHNTIVDNAKYGGGGGISSQYQSKPQIINSIIWNNGQYQISGQADVTYSDIQGGLFGRGNLVIDPLFQDSENGDYRLQDSSPCIGRGSLEQILLSDLDGKQRPSPTASNPDLGAYENEGEESEDLLLVSTYCPVDLEITDPRGRKIGKTISQIPLAIYEELDLNDDQDLDDRVIIPEALPGDYLIRVQPEPGADPNSVFTLDVAYGKKVTRLAKNFPVADLGKDFKTFQIKLGAGWNLISLPTQLPSNNPVIVLDSVISDCESVWTCNEAGEWQGYFPADFLMNFSDLQTMETGKGYWLNMETAATLVLSKGILENNPIALKTGWNLVGYNSLQPRKVANALASISGKCKTVQTFDAGSGKWEKYFFQGPVFLNNLQNFEPGKGYWIEVSQDCEWILTEEAGVSATNAGSVFQFTLPPH
ncbi:MAG: PKD domain-containing protein, partial [bacterium]|nr:PKD domain-containing protein [bacterium]